jgi:hypothetical protein
MFMRQIFNINKGITWLWFICLAGSFGPIYCQEQHSWQWASQMGGKSWDIISGIACDQKDFLYLTGSFSDTLVCGDKKIASKGGQDIFLARLDNKGNIRELIDCGGEGRDMAGGVYTTRDNEVILGGIIQGNATFDNLKCENSGTALFVAKRNSNGRFSWSTTLASTGESSLFLVKAGDDGEIYAAGTFTGTLIGGNTVLKSTGRKDVFVLRLDPSGKIRKMISFGGEGDDIPTAMSEPVSGSVLLTFTSGKAFDWNDLHIDLIGNKQESSAYILRFDSEFNLLAERSFISNEYVHISAVQHDAGNNLYVTGSFSYDLSPGDTTINAVGKTDGFVICINPDGRLRWSRSIGSRYYDYANNLVVDHQGGVIITGVIGDSLQIGQQLIAPKEGLNSSLAIQFSSEGRLLWFDCLSGDGRSFSNGAALDRKGNLYVAGSFSNILDNHSIKLNSRGDDDVYLAKYYNCESQRLDIIGDAVICPDKETVLHIRPDYTHVVWNDTLPGVTEVVAASPGKYWVTAKDERGCTLTDTLEVIVGNEPSFSLGGKARVPVSETYLIQGPQHARDYCWQDYSHEPDYLAEATNTKPGVFDFWLAITDSLGCTSLDSISVEFYTPRSGSLDIKNGQLLIYPNPVSDWIYWKLDTRESCSFNIELVDNAGKCISNQRVQDYVPGTEMKVNTQHLPYGTYYLRFSDDQGQSIKSENIVKR